MLYKHCRIFFFYIFSCTLKQWHKIGSNLLIGKFCHLSFHSNAHFKKGNTLKLYLFWLAIWNTIMPQNQASLMRFSWQNRCKFFWYVFEWTEASLSQTEGMFSSVVLVCQYPIFLFMLSKMHCKIVQLIVLIVVLQNSNRIVHVKSCFERNDITVLDKFDVKKNNRPLF